METADVSEVSNGWENVQVPPATTTAAGQWDDDGDVVVVYHTFSNDASIFPPSDHEGLPVAAAAPQDHLPQEPPPAIPATPLNLAEDDVHNGPVESRLRARLRILSSGIFRVAYGIRSYAVCGVGFWSFGAAALVVAAAALYGCRLWRLRIRVEQESKEQLMLLIRQKDQKINQLLSQIARMNEILSVRRRVPILRIVVDSPHIISQ